MCKTPSPSLFFPLFPLFVLVSFGQLQASIITTPTDLNVGDQYRLVFVTSGTMTAESGDIADYNTFVDGFGDVAIASDWKAIGSTSEVDASENTLTRPDVDSASSVPIYNLAGQRVADGYVDLWDQAILAAIDVTETGTEMSTYTQAWTGTTVEGDASESGVLGEGYPLDQVVYGYVGLTDFQWIRANAVPGTNINHVYGMSGTLTVSAPDPIPEPASVITWTLLGIVGCVGTWWNRRRKAS